MLSHVVRDKSDDFFPCEDVEESVARHEEELVCLPHSGHLDGA
jgi:predicted alpha/beta hydrolase family esterase